MATIKAPCEASELTVEVTSSPSSSMWLMTARSTPLTMIKHPMAIPQAHVNPTEYAHATPDVAHLSMPIQCTCDPGPCWSTFVHHFHQPTPRSHPNRENMAECAVKPATTPCSMTSAFSPMLIDCAMSVTKTTLNAQAVASAAS